MKLMEIYRTDYTKLGSPRMVALFESLMSVPLSERKVTPVVPPVIVRGNQIKSGYWGSLIQLEQELYGLCLHLGVDTSEARSMIDKANTGGAYVSGY